MRTPRDLPDTWPKRLGPDGQFTTGALGQRADAAMPEPAVPAGGYVPPAGYHDAERPVAAPPGLAAGDPMAKLPEPARLKLRALLAEQEDLQSIAVDLSQRRQPLVDQKQRAIGARDRLTD